MAEAIRKGDPVRQVVTVIEGVVAGFSIDPETGDRQTLVSWSDQDGAQHERYFLDGEIEKVA